MPVWQFSLPPCADPAHKHSTNGCGHLGGQGAHSQGCSPVRMGSRGGAPPVLAVPGAWGEVQRWGTGSEWNSPFLQFFTLWGDGRSSPLNGGPSTGT